MKNQLFYIRIVKSVCILNFILLFQYGTAVSAVIPLEPRYDLSIMLDMGIHLTSSSDLQLPYFYNEKFANVIIDGSGFTFGIFTHIFFGNPDSTRHSMTLNLNYSSIMSRYETGISDIEKYIKPIDVNYTGKYSLNGKIEHELRTIDFRVLYNYNIIGKLFISFGPRFLFVLKNNLVEIVGIDEAMKNKIKYSDDLKPVRYKDNNLTAILTDGQPYGSQDVLFGLNIELKNQIKLSEKTDIIPYCGYNSIITTLTKRSDWTLTSIYFGVCLKYKFL